LQESFAILPVGGLIITVGYLESTLSSSGLSKMPFYFPGFGLLTAIILIYLIGLGVTTFVAIGNAGQRCLESFGLNGQD